MTAQFLPALIIIAIVIVIMIKQINKAADRAESQVVQDPKLYAQFAAIIQEKIRSVRLDVEGAKDGAKFVLLEGADKANVLEKLSDLIRKLVFFETMIGKSSDTQAELFAALQELDELLNENFVDGDLVADEIRDELFREYERLKNGYQIDAM